MKYIKLYEEHIIDKNEKYEIISFTPNEIAYMKTKGEVYEKNTHQHTYTDSGKRVDIMHTMFNDNRVEKLGDGMYVLVASNIKKFKCSSIQELIKLVIHYNDEYKNTVDKIIVKDKIASKNSEYYLKDSRYFLFEVNDEGLHLSMYLISLGNCYIDYKIKTLRALILERFDFRLREEDIKFGHSLSMPDADYKVEI